MVPPPRAGSLPIQSEDHPLVRRLPTPLLTLLALLLPASFAAAQVNDVGNASPPFRAGQVTVYATPDQLPGVQIVKYLENAQLSVIRVPVGMEQPIASFLRDQGLVAGLNYLAQKSGTVNDPFNSFQWHFTAVQANAAWDI